MPRAPFAAQDPALWSRQVHLVFVGEQMPRERSQELAADDSILLLDVRARALPPRRGIAGFETQPSTNFPEQVHRHSIERWCDEAGELPAAQTDKRKPPLTGRGAPILSQGFPADAQGHECGNDDNASSTVSLSPSLSLHQTSIPLQQRDARVDGPFPRDSTALAPVVSTPFSRVCTHGQQLAATPMKMPLCSRHPRLSPTPSPPSSSSASLTAPTTATPSSTLAAQF